MKEFKKFLITLSLVVWAIIAIASFGMAIEKGVNPFLVSGGLVLQGVGIFFFIRTMIKSSQK